MRMLAVVLAVAAVMALGCGGAEQDSSACPCVFACPNPPPPRCEAWAQRARTVCLAECLADAGVHP